MRFNINIEESTKKDKNVEKYFSFFFAFVPQV